MQPEATHGKNQPLRLVIRPGNWHTRIPVLVLFRGDTEIEGAPKINLDNPLLANIKSRSSIFSLTPEQLACCNEMFFKPLLQATYASIENQLLSDEASYDVMEAVKPDATPKFITTDFPANSPLGDVAKEKIWAIAALGALNVTTELDSLVRVLTYIEQHAADKGTALTVENTLPPKASRSR